MINLTKINLVKIFLGIFGFAFFVGGLILMVVPIPFGFVFVIIGLVLLSPIPFFKKILDYFEKKDKTRLLKRLGERTQKFDESLERGLDEKIFKRKY